MKKQQRKRMKDGQDQRVLSQSRILTRKEARLLGSRHEESSEDEDAENVEHESTSEERKKRQKTQFAKQTMKK